MFLLIFPAAKKPGQVFDNSLSNLAAAKKPDEGAGHTLPWLIVTAVGIVIGALAILGGSLSFYFNIYIFFCYFDWRGS